MSHDNIAFDEGVYLEGLGLCRRRYRYDATVAHQVAVQLWEEGAVNATIAHQLVAKKNNPAIFDTPSTLEVEHSSTLRRVLAVARFLPAGTYAGIKDALANFDRERRAALMAGDRQKAWQLGIQYGVSVAWVVAGAAALWLERVIGVVLRLEKIIELVWKAIKWWLG
jgi:hypothetical protein